MKLKSMRIQNFRSFRDSTVQFPDSGLVLIRGKNEATGEPSGTGKSSVFLALSYVLDTLPPEYSAKALQNWDVKSEMQVTLHLQMGNEEVVLSRGKNTFVQRGETVVNGAKSYSTELQRLFGFGPEVLRALTYRPQGEGGLFLSLPPAGKLELLTRVLGLENVEVAVDEAQTKARGLESKVGVAKQLLDMYTKGLEAALATESSRTAKVQVADVAVMKQKLNELLAAQGIAQANVNGLNEQARQQAEAAKLERDRRASGVKVNLDKAREFLRSVRSEQAGVESQRSQAMMEASNRLTSAKRSLEERERKELQIEKLRLKVQKLSAGQCPTCEQTWDQSKAKRDEIEDEIEGLKKSMGDDGALEEHILDCQESLRKAALPSVRDPRLDQLEGVERKLMSDWQAITSEPLPRPEALDGREAAQLELESIQRAADAYRSSIATEEAVVRGMEAAQKLFDEDVANRRLAVQKATQELATVEGEYNVERDFIAAMGREGFLGLVVDEVLAEIADKANKQLSALPNTSDVSVAFETETEKGKRQIQSIATVRGHKTKIAVGLSGGMQTSLAQVVDLAFNEVVESRAGGRIPGWLCLDEVFEGQGNPTKERALQVLSDGAADKLILVIDHGSEFKESLGQVIEVQFDNGVSKVQP